LNAKLFHSFDLPDWLDYVTRQHWQKVDMGLSRMRIMCERLELFLPASKVITVAGTNGKGTTCHALEQLLLDSGYSVGTSLSPHIDRFNERIRIAGHELDDETICRAFAEIEAARERLTLTYFEYSTLAALLTFKEADLDIAILEIGLGGRLDAFNVIDADIAVITNIAFDHQELLGNTLHAIGREKAGILRRGQKVVLGAGMPRSVFNQCERLDLQPFVFGVDFDVEYHDHQQTWTFANLSASSNLPGTVKNIETGQCAPANMALAYATVAHLMNAESADAGIRKLSRSLSIRGRLECRAWEGRTLISDVAHNPAGALFLCRELAFRGIKPDLIVCGMLQGKDHGGVYAAVSEKLSADWVLITTFGDRAFKCGELDGAMGHPGALLLDTEEEDLASFLRSATVEGDVILAFGSFSTVEQARLNPDPTRVSSC